MGKENIGLLTDKEKNKNQSSENTNNNNYHWENYRVELVDRPCRTIQRNEKAQNFPQFNVFMFFFLLTLGMGLSEIDYYCHKYMHLVQEDFLTFYTYIGSYLIFVFMSFVLAYAYILLIVKFKEIGIYIMMAVSLLIFIVFTAICYIYEYFTFSVISTVILAIYFLSMLIYRKELKSGITMFPFVSVIISLKKNILYSPIPLSLISFLLSYFGSLSLDTTLQIRNYLTQTKSINLYETFTVFLLIFMGILSFFVLWFLGCFTLSDLCADWYFKMRDKEGKRITRVYRRSFKQIGSFIFPALSILFLPLIRFFICKKGRKSNKKIVSTCSNIPLCFPEQTEDKINVFNRYTVFILAITKQDFINGVSMTSDLIGGDHELMSIANVMSNLLLFVGYTISVLIPTLLSFVTVSLSEKNKEIDIEQTWKISLMVGISSLMVSTPIIQTISELFSCAFVYFAYDRELVLTKKIQESRIDLILRNAFIDISKNKESHTLCDNNDIITYESSSDYNSIKEFRKSETNTKAIF